MSELFAVWSAVGGICCWMGAEGLEVSGQRGNDRVGLEKATGVRGGDTEIGEGSRVERAAAVLSPRSSAPRLLDFRRGRGMFGRDDFCGTCMLLMAKS